MSNQTGVFYMSTALLFGLIFLMAPGAGAGCFDDLGEMNNDGSFRMHLDEGIKHGRVMLEHLKAMTQEARTAFQSGTLSDLFEHKSKSGEEGKRALEHGKEMLKHFEEALQAEDSTEEIKREGKRILEKAQAALEGLKRAIRSVHEGEGAKEMGAVKDAIQKGLRDTEEAHSRVEESIADAQKM